MLRTSTLGPLLAAMLVLVSGATVGLAAASHAPTPADASATQADASPTQLPAQDNGTMGNETADNETADDEETMGNETMDNETTDNETADGETVAENATVTFRNQSTNGSAVLVNETTLPEGGFVVIHLANKTSPGNFTVGPVVGNSTYLESGSHENLTIALDENETLNESQWLTAMPHNDTNDNRTYDFPIADDPYTIDGPVPVTDEAYAEVVPDAETVDVMGNGTAATGNGTIDVDNVTVDVENATTEGNETTGNETMDDGETMGNETTGNESDTGGDYAIGR